MFDAPDTSTTGSAVGAQDIGARRDLKGALRDTQSTHSKIDYSLLTRPLHSLADLVASVKMGVHAKLLCGFLVGAVLLVGMGGLSLVVIERMTQRVEDITLRQEQVDRARQMMYAVTGQSHYRAMALLTNDDSNNAKIAGAKQRFSNGLASLEATSDPEQSRFLRQLRQDNERFAASSQKVLEVYEAGDIDQALKLHLDEEHEVSHDLEHGMLGLIAGSNIQMDRTVSDFRSDREFLQTMVAIFAVASLVVALLLGLILSSSFVRALRRIERAVAGIASGDFTQRVAIPNRDEFGALSKNVNGMSEQLESLYEKLSVELTERKLVEEALAQRAISLEAANQELEAFSYSVSHDLRAPLRSIDGFSQALLEDYAEVLDEEGQDHLRRVRAGSQRMAQLIDDILELSRVTRSEMDREAVDLSLLASSVVEELRTADPDRNVEVIIADGLSAYGDARLLSGVLENLLANAWKFSSKRQEARIEFGVEDIDGKPTYFVRDDGVGFDGKYADKLFTAFQRLHSDDEFKGTGIGLATVQRIVKRHGGRIWAQGRVGHGATFHFTL